MNIFVFEVVDLDVVRRILYQKKSQYGTVCLLGERERRTKLVPCSVPGYICSVVSKKRGF